MNKMIFAANWKMYKSPKEALDYVNELLPLVSPEQQKQIILFAQNFSVPILQQVLARTSIQWGAQNIYPEFEGAFTGENSPRVLKELGATHTLIGHSERRNIFSESDEMVAKKLAVLQSLGICPVLCIGESLKEREANQTLEVLKKQLEIALGAATAGKTLVIAYEPVWAIGTGKVASPDQAQEAQAYIRKEVSRLLGEPTAKSIAILYGGSVKPDNAQELSAKPDIDGFLIGGASLKVSSFLEIIKNSVS